MLVLQAILHHLQQPAKIHRTRHSSGVNCVHLGVECALKWSSSLHVTMQTRMIKCSRLDQCNYLLHLRFREI